VRTAVIFLVAGALLAGCGEEDPESKPGDLTKLKGAPAPLAALHDQANDLLEGGEGAFKERLDELEGYPIVINKWASWCGPCRAEFPFFQEHSIRLGKKVAFLGVNSNDNDDDAADFLDKYPVSYPSYKDPTTKVSKIFNAQIAFPSTAFYDAKGELQYVKQGGYLSEEDFVEDLERYAK
jgi:thiol-disulfide isomerase/thioredoxin